MSKFIFDTNATSDDTKWWLYFYTHWTTNCRSHGKAPESNRWDRKVKWTTTMKKSNRSACTMIFPHANRCVGAGAFDWVEKKNQQTRRVRLRCTQWFFVYQTLANISWYLFFMHSLVSLVQQWMIQHTRPRCWCRRLQYKKEHKKRFSRFLSSLEDYKRYLFCYDAKYVRHENPKTHRKRQTRWEHSTIG